MRARLLLCMLSLALAACAHKPPAAPAAPPAPPVPPAVAAEPVRPDAMAPLLVYHQSLRRMGQAELVKELSSLNGQPKSVTQSMLSAMVLIQLRGGGDLPRAQGMLENVLGASEPEAQAVAPLARLLAAYCADLRRGAEHVDRLAAQVKEGQRRNEQLSEIVEGLKTIERTLPARPATAPSPVTGVVK